MAAAARPGSSHPGDARVPCPLCGGLIHPIAGRCKHCKADLTSYRAARPAAAAPLPALGQPSPANGHPGHGGPLPAAAHAVLPPRPTAAGTTARPTGRAWRSWPVLVIVLATVAIVAAAVLMVWPAGHRRDSKKALQPPPAPERMDTQTPAIIPGSDPRPPRAPSPSSAPDDPWATPNRTPSDPPPSAGPAPADPSAQNDDDSDDTDALDPIAPPAQAGHRAPLDRRSTLVLAMTLRLCHKVVECGNADPMMQSACDAIAGMSDALPASCPAAERCLRRIDAMTCSSRPDATQPFALLAQFRDCADAARC